MDKEQLKLRAIFSTLGTKQDGNKTMVTDEHGQRKHRKLNWKRCKSNKNKQNSNLEQA